MVSIGSGEWRNGSDVFSAVLSDSIKRERLVSSIGDLVLRYNLSGIDLDWYHRPKGQYNDFVRNRKIKIK